MRVLVNGLSDRFGGVESLFFSLLRCDSLSDLSMDFISPVSKCAREEEFLNSGSKVIHMPRPSKQIRQYIHSFREAFKGNIYSIYHVNLTRYRFPLDVILAKMAGLKVVIHCHSTQIYDFGNKKIKMIRLGEQYLFRPFFSVCSDLNLACSKNAGDYLFGKGKYTILHNGINLDKYVYDQNARNRIRNEFGIDEKHIVVGHVGRMSFEKNTGFLIELMDTLLKLDNNYRLLLVGDGMLFDDLKDKARQMGLADKTIFTGQRTDVADLLSAMDVFMLPSFHEALPIVLIEAQANGLPCVVSDCVTKEVDINSLVTRLSLKEPGSAWIEAIRKAIGKRITEIEKDDFEDFEISNTKKKLYDYYYGLTH